MDFEIRKMSHWPRAPFDVYGQTPYGMERFAGGFWTRRGAQSWIDEETEE